MPTLPISILARNVVEASRRVPVGPGQHSSRRLDCSFTRHWTVPSAEERLYGSSHDGANALDVLFP